MFMLVIWAVHFVSDRAHFADSVDKNVQQNFNVRFPCNGKEKLETAVKF